MLITKIGHRRILRSLLEKAAHLLSNPAILAKHSTGTGRLRRGRQLRSVLTVGTRGLLRCCSSQRASEWKYQGVWLKCLVIYRGAKRVYMCVYICIYTYMCVYMCINIFLFFKEEKKRLMLVSCTLRLFASQSCVSQSP